MLILQHPREHNFAIGTAHMASLVLTGSELRVNIDFSSDPVMRNAISATQHPTVLLFPDPETHDVHAEPPAKPITLIVLDGT